MYKITALFRDENQPKITSEAKTRGQAVNEAQHFTKQFAGLKCVYIDNPNGERDVINPAGEYLYTIPAEGLNNDKGR